jgi:hypothetical protein
MALDRTTNPPKFSRSNVANVADINNDRHKRKQTNNNDDDNSGVGKFSRAPLTFPDPNTFNLVHELTENRDKYRASSRDDGVWIGMTSIPRYISHSMAQIISLFTTVKPPGLWTVYSACIDNGLRWLLQRDECKKLSTARRLWKESEDGKLLDKIVSDIVGEMLDARRIETEGGSKQTCIIPFYVSESLNRASEALGFKPAGLAKIAIMVTLKEQTGDISGAYQEEMQQVVKDFVYGMGIRARIGGVVLEEFGVTDDE